MIMKFTSSDDRANEQLCELNDRPECVYELLSYNKNNFLVYSRTIKFCI